MKKYGGNNNTLMDTFKVIAYTGYAYVCICVFFVSLGSLELELKNKYILFN